AFATEVWKPGPRFYGTGETFVFTLHPQRVRYVWQRPRQQPLPGRASGGGAAATATASQSPASPSQQQQQQQGHGGGGVAAAAAVAAAVTTAAAAASGVDFFQFSTHEGLGVGGQGGFALWLDNELLEGASYPCDTFGSPQLSGREEFRVAAVELWQL
ncbi:hypothetical protein Agub_g15044, partial [Astrephomene gubernaculifera]